MPVFPALWRDRQIRNLRPSSATQGVRSQPWLHETLSQKQKKTKQNNQKHPWMYSCDSLTVRFQTTMLPDTAPWDLCPSNQGGCRLTACHETPQGFPFASTTEHVPSSRVGLSVELAGFSPLFFLLLATFTSLPQKGCGSGEEISPNT